MAHMSLFENKAFSQTTLVAAYDEREVTPGRLSQMGLAEVVRSRTTTVSIEKRPNHTGLVRITPRAAPLPERGPDRRNLREFKTARIGEGDTMYSHEIQDIRAFGSETELMQAASEMSRRFAEIDMDLALTEEHMLLGMVQGKFVDSDGSVVYDWAEEFGVTPAANKTFDFTNATLAQLRLLCMDIKETIRKNNKGSSMNGIVGLCGYDFFSAFVTNPEVQKTYEGYAAAAELRGDALAGNRFYFGGITFEHYEGTNDGSSVAVAADECHFFPVGARGLFKHVLAPGESMDVVNRPGARRYPRVIRDTKRNEWVRMEMKTYPLFVCTNPAMLMKGVAT